MEIVSIERKTFEELVAKFDRFVSRMDTICHRQCEKKMSEWMDNQDVCRMLNISHARCRRFGTTELWHTAKSTTKRITVPRRAAYRLHRGGQAERSKVQRQDNLTTE